MYQLLNFLCHLLGSFSIICCMLPILTAWLCIIYILIFHSVSLFRLFGFASSSLYSNNLLSVMFLLFLIFIICSLFQLSSLCHLFWLSDIVLPSLYSWHPLLVSSVLTIWHSIIFPSFLTSTVSVICFDCLTLYCPCCIWVIYSLLTNLLFDFVIIFLPTNPLFMSSVLAILTLLSAFLRSTTLFVSSVLTLLTLLSSSLYSHHLVVYFDFHFVISFFLHYLLRVICFYC